MKEKTEEVQSAEEFFKSIIDSLNDPCGKSARELIEARDKAICKAQKEICSKMSNNTELDWFEELVLNAPDAI